MRSLALRWLVLLCLVAFLGHAGLADARCENMLVPLRRLASRWPRAFSPNMRSTPASPPSSPRCGSAQASKEPVGQDQRQAHGRRARPVHGRLISLPHGRPAPAACLPVVCFGRSVGEYQYDHYQSDLTYSACLASVIVCERVVGSDGGLASHTSVTQQFNRITYYCHSTIHRGWLLRVRPLEMYHGFAGAMPAHDEERPAKRVEEGGVRGRKPHGAAERRRRLVMPPQLLQHLPLDVPPARRVGKEKAGAARACQRLALAPGLAVSPPAVRGLEERVECGTRLRDRAGLAFGLDGLRFPAILR
jgi:hypothetical protein